MLKNEASSIVGGLSQTSKMPCKSYGLSAYECITGVFLSKIEGSVCSGCYAKKGLYRANRTRHASVYAKRLDSLADPRWVEAMVTLIQGMPYFRWHDTGDVQSLEHLKNIYAVARGTPGTKHWMPTHEYGFFLEANALGIAPPENMTVRLSAPRVDQAPLVVKAFGPLATCTVHDSGSVYGHCCDAGDRVGQCGDCRVCWDATVRNVSYKKH